MLFIPLIAFLINLFILFSFNSKCIVTISTAIYFCLCYWGLSFLWIINGMRILFKLFLNSYSRPIFSFSLFFYIFLAASTLSVWQLSLNCLFNARCKFVSSYQCRQARVLAILGRLSIFPHTSSCIVRICHKEIPQYVFQAMLLEKEIPFLSHLRNLSAIKTSFTIQSIHRFPLRFL